MYRIKRIFNVAMNIIPTTVNSCSKIVYFSIPSIHCLMKTAQKK